MRKSSIFFTANLLFLMSCVSPKIHNSLISDFESSQQKLTKQEKESLILSDQIEELNSTSSRIKNKLNNLKNDSIQNGKAVYSLRKKYDELNTSYDLLSSESSREMANKAKEVKILLSQLEVSQNKLLVKEDELNLLSLSLSEKEEELNKSQQSLQERSIRVTELEKIINQKDSLVTNIKNKVSKALGNLEGEGLTIEQRNGKIYISLEEDLLFASGRYEINQTGEDALNKLSSVLSNQENIRILVEGHTDNIPINGNKKLIKDNWDLSVMRSTSVVKILLNNTKLDPIQLTAAGRGKHNPIANNETIEGRKMNRRIDLIVSPNLDDLYDILED